MQTVKQFEAELQKSKGNLSPIAIKQLKGGLDQLRVELYGAHDDLFL